MTAFWNKHVAKLNQFIYIEWPYKCSVIILFLPIPVSPSAGLLFFSSFSGGQADCTSCTMGLTQSHSHSPSPAPPTLDRDDAPRIHMEPSHGDWESGSRVVHATNISTHRPTAPLAILIDRFVRDQITCLLTPTSGGGLLARKLGQSVEWMLEPRLWMNIFH